MLKLLASIAPVELEACVYEIQESSMPSGSTANGDVVAPVDTIQTLAPGSQGKVEAFTLWVAKWVGTSGYPRFALVQSVDCDDFLEES